MRLKVTLERDVSVTRYKVRAELLVHTKMDHIMPVLAHAREHDGIATVQSLTDELFIGFRIISEKILDVCAEYRLMKHQPKKNRYVMTKHGERALDEKMAFVPQTGTWEMHYAPDPLIGAEYSILELDPKKDIVSFANGGLDYEQPKLDDLPYDIRGLVDKELATTFGTRTRFIIKDIYPHQKELSTVKRRLYLSISEDEAALSVDDTHMPTRKIKHKQLWRNLLERAKDGGMTWNDKRGRFLVEYEDISNEERTYMERYVNFYISHYDYGDLKAKNVRLPIYPKTKADAQKWAVFLLVNGMTDYQTAKRYQRLTSRIRKRFPDFDVVMPKRTDIPAEALNRRWYVQAPEDWNL